MQDQISNFVGFYCALEETTFCQDALLSLEFLQSSWPHAISQWCKPPPLLFSMEGEKILIHHRSVNKSSVVDENRVTVIDGIFLKVPF
jgi:hypothetical protein